MPRPLCTVLVSFVLVTNLLAVEAQESKSQSSETEAHSNVGDDAQLMSLLQQSHDINQQLPVRARFFLLTEQAQLASQMSVDLGRAWANELFALSFQTKGDQRSTTQESAMGMLARLDPDRALVLLHSMSMEEPETYRTTSPPKMQLVQRVFEVLAARDGVSAIPSLEQEAALLGIEGHYPYGALGFAEMRAVSKEWPKDRTHALEGVQSVFERAFARYSQSGRGYFDDCEFGNMLEVVGGSLPGESVQPGLRRLVKNLLETDTNKYHFHAEVRTSDGKTAKAEQLPDDNKRASTMLEVARTIAGDYPERAAELIVEMQRRNKPIDDELQLNLISAQASVAAAQDKKNELHELLQRGLEAANHIILEQQRTDTLHFVDGVASLVQDRKSTRLN